tara:strand:+ start:202 stop:450 length:249 start_codon:yes stop_codon:yes gene_type:complete
MSETLARVKSLAENAALYIPEDCESMRIVACVEEHFLTEGEETGESYQIYFSEVDLENDIFYRFTSMDNKAPIGWYATEDDL